MGRSSSPGHLRMVLRTSLGVIIILTLLVIASGSIPKTNSGSEVAGDHLNVGDINLDSYGIAGVRDIVKRDADGNAGERNAKPNKTTKPNVSKRNRNADNGNEKKSNSKKKIRQKGRKRRQRNKIKKKGQQKGKKKRSKKRHGKTGRKGRNGKKAVRRRKAAGKKAKKSNGKKRQGRTGEMGRKGRIRKKKG